ncbi:unnamed protein product [Paramecium octaurelia]|uniref:Uncharacterized protein n=1 Tax=Paramecium octaurelia TaxID=43137 RepID=A0A8S1S3J6_PAROT|nr:unnamed protein product [Paramecium octaurelia]
MQSYSFDYILDQFIGFGRYQLQTFANSCALSCNFGNLALLLSLLLKLYKQELDITMNKVILLAVCFGWNFRHEIQQYFGKNKNYKIFIISIGICLIICINC